MPLIKQPEKPRTEISKNVSLEGISYKSLIISIISFIVGVVCVLILQNSLSEKISFSTFDLINFLVVIGLSVASATLAMVAIVLGKKSEEIIVSRSDQSIKHQTEIFQETIKALAKIESSSGINEKRIEDVLKVVGGTGLRDEKRINEETRKILTSPSTIDARKQIEKIRLTNKESQEYHDNILNEVRKINKIKIFKAGEGNFSGTGHKLVDGVFKFKKETFSLSIFYIDDPLNIFDSFSKGLLSGYILRLAREISKNVFHKSFLIFNLPVNKDVKFNNMYKNTMLPLSREIRQNLNIFTGNPQNIIQQIIKEQKINISKKQK